MTDVEYEGMLSIMRTSSVTGLFDLYAKRIAEAGRDLPADIQQQRERCHSENLKMILRAMDSTQVLPYFEMQAKEYEAQAGHPAPDLATRKLACVKRHIVYLEQQAKNTQSEDYSRHNLELAKSLREEFKIDGPV